MWSALIGMIFFQASLWAAPPPPKTCVNLTGNYVLPLGKHDRTGDPPILMIDQDHCRLIDVVTGYSGFIPIGEPSSLDGTEGFFIVGNTIVEKGSLSIPTANHGQCSALSVAMSLDSNNNLLFTSPKVYGCEDRYRGPLRDTFPRVAPSPGQTAKPASTAAGEDGLTCTDGNGHSVKISDSSFTFQNLDAVGFPSEKTFAIIGSHYVEVPGGPAYSEYTGASDDVLALVRISGTEAEVWMGRNAKGNPVFKGVCNGAQI